MQPGAERGPARVEDLDGDLEAVPALAEDVEGRHAHVLELDRNGRGPLEAELLLLLAGRHAAEVLGHDEGRDPPVLVGRAELHVAGEDREELGEAAVGDPVLRPVEDELVLRLVEDGRRPDRRRVRAGLGLGQRERRDHLAGGERRAATSSSAPRSRGGSGPSGRSTGGRRSGCRATRPSGRSPRSPGSRPTPRSRSRRIPPGSTSRRRRAPRGPGEAPATRRARARSSRSRRGPGRIPGRSRETPTPSRARTRRSPGTGTPCPPGSLPQRAISRPGRGGRRPARRRKDDPSWRDLPGRGWRIRIEAHAARWPGAGWCRPGRSGGRAARRARRGARTRARGRSRRRGAAARRETAGSPSRRSSRGRACPDRPTISSSRQKAASLIIGSTSRACTTSARQRRLVPRRDAQGAR